MFFSLYTILYQFLQGKCDDDLVAQFRYRSRVKTQIAFGVVLRSCVILFSCASVSILVEWANTAITIVLTVIGLVLLGTVTLILSASSKNKSALMLTKNAAVVGSACCYLIAFLLIAFQAEEWILMYTASEHLGLSVPSVRHWIENNSALVGLFFVWIIFGMFVNINYLGMHRVYRDRLTELFLPNRETVKKGGWDYATAANDAMLHDMCVEAGKNGTGTGVSKARLPYHILNCNVVLVNSSQTRYRERGGDNFILSPLYCGSTATRWCETRNYLGITDPGISLGTAMAISGAAANPRAGFGGEGAMRNPLLSIVLSVLGLRLGYWAPNPRKLANGARRIPGVLNPGIYHGMFSKGLSECGRFVDLTDGGHFENLGLYEMVRRRVRFIVVVDASYDPEYEFASLKRALELARLDFGTEMRWYETEVSESKASKRLCQEEALKVCINRGYVTAEVIYHDSLEGGGECGKLIYIKPVMVSGSGEQSEGFARPRMGFPQEATSDQFFDESQFESYRRLGEAIAAEAFTEPGNRDLRKESG